MVLHKCCSCWSCPIHRRKFRKKIQISPHNSEWNNININNQNIKTFEYTHVLSQTVTPSLSQHRSYYTDLLLTLPSCVPDCWNTSFTDVKNHSSKILRTSLIFLYVKNDIVTDLLNHATQNIMVAIGSWSKRLLDFPKFSRQSGPHICIIMLKKLRRFLFLQIWRPAMYIPLHTPLHILCKLMAYSLSSSKSGVNTHLN